MTRRSEGVYRCMETLYSTEMGRGKPRRENVAMPWETMVCVLILAPSM
jgi:hypothetical protein